MTSIRVRTGPGVDYVVPRVDELVREIYAVGSRLDGFTGPGCWFEDEVASRQAGLPQNGFCPADLRFLRRWSAMLRASPKENTDLMVEHLPWLVRIPPDADLLSAEDFKGFDVIEVGDALVVPGRGVNLATGLLHLRRPRLCPWIEPAVGWALGFRKENYSSRDLQSARYSFTWILRDMRDVALGNIDSLQEMADEAPFESYPLHILAMILGEVGSPFQPFSNMGEYVDDRIRLWHDFEPAQEAAVSAEDALEVAHSIGELGPT